MSKIANKQMICEVLMEAAKTDKDIVALCSDSRGSGSFTPFAETYPDQFVETGIAEQNLVSISAGLAKCGKKSYAGLLPVVFRVLLCGVSGTPGHAAGAGGAGASLPVRAAVYAVHLPGRVLTGLPGAVAEASRQKRDTLADAAVLCVCASYRYGGGVRHCTEIFRAYFGAADVKRRE